MSHAREDYGDIGISSLLRREDERRLRAKAWRHLRRINAARARRIWRKVRMRDRMRLAA